MGKRLIGCSTVQTFLEIDSVTPADCFRPAVASYVEDGTGIARYS